MKYWWLLLRNKYAINITGWGHILFLEYETKGNNLFQETRTKGNNLLQETKTKGDNLFQEQEQKEIINIGQFVVL